ncbi:MAG: hypothetical protein ACEQSE_06235 [Candidatus Aquirickettsiella gammari]
MIDSSNTRAIDLVVAVPVGAFSAFALFFGIGYIFLPFKMIEGDVQLLLITAFFIFLPISIVAALSSYFVLRRFCQLGAFQLALVGCVSGMVIAIFLPAKDFSSGSWLTVCSFVGALSAYPVLAWLAKLRACRKTKI